MFSRYEKPSLSQLAEILSYLSCDDREQWFKVFCIVGREYPNDNAAFEVCQQWSSKYAGRKSEDAIKERNEFYISSRRAGPTIGALIKQAKANGYKPQISTTAPAPAAFDVFGALANRAIKETELKEEQKSLYGTAQEAAQRALKFWLWNVEVNNNQRTAFMRRYGKAFDTLPEREGAYFKLVYEFCISHSLYSYPAFIDWAEEHYSDFDEAALRSFLAYAKEADNHEAADEAINKAIQASWRVNLQRRSEDFVKFLTNPALTLDQTEQGLAMFLSQSKMFNPQLPAHTGDDIAPIGRRVITELITPSLMAMHYQPTTYEPLDRHIYGWRRGEVTIMAAHSGVGKTWFGVDASNRVIENGGDVLFITTEMSKDSIAQRFYENTGRVSVNTLKESVYQEDLLNAATKDNEAFYKSAKSLNIVYADQLSDVVNAIDSRNDYESVGLVVVDYLQNIVNNDPSQRGAASWERVKHTMEQLTKAAARNNCPILVLAQLNNPNRKSTANQSPNLYDIADATAVVRDAAAVIVMYKAGDKDESINELRCKIVKSRYGDQPESHFKVNRTTGSRFSFV